MPAEKKRTFRSGWGRKKRGMFQYYLQGKTWVCTVPERKMVAEVAQQLGKAIGRKR